MTGGRLARASPPRVRHQRPAASLPGLARCEESLRTPAAEAVVLARRAVGRIHAHGGRDVEVVVDLGGGPAPERNGGRIRPALCTRQPSQARVRLLLLVRTVESGGPRRPAAVTRRGPWAPQPVVAQRQRLLAAVSGPALSTWRRAPALLTKQSRSGRCEAVGTTHGLPGRQRYVVSVW